MFLSIRHKPHLAAALKIEVINRDTGEKIPRVIWANDETGRYRQLLADENGIILANTKRTAALSKIFTGNIELRWI